MSKFDEAISTYRDAFSKIGVTPDKNLLQAVAKGLGPSIYNADAKYVACGDSEERDRVRERFLVKKLGLSNKESLDAAIKRVCEKCAPLGSTKHRAVVYYLLVKEFGKEGAYA